MQTVVIVVHIVVCLALIAIVLLQTGKGAEMGATFGSGSSRTLFGSSGGATFMGKLTTGVAVMFVVTCLVLSYFGGRPDTKSVMDQVPVETEQGPVVPDAKPVQGTSGPAGEDVRDTPAPGSTQPLPAPTTVTPKPMTEQPTQATPTAQPPAADQPATPTPEPASSDAQPAPAPAAGQTPPAPAASDTPPATPATPAPAATPAPGNSGQ